MKNILKPGDKRSFTKTVSKEDIAVFETGKVHDLYSTFALARDAEWCSRLFVLDIKENDEEGIGTSIEIKHLSPALAGSEVIFTATVNSVKGNNLICDFEARVGDRIIAQGSTGQKVLKKSRLEEILRQL